MDGFETPSLCAYDKARQGATGSIACSIGNCMVTLFTRASTETPTNTSIFFSCGQPVYPAGTMEWQQVEVRRDTAMTADGQEVVRISYRDEFRPVAE